MGMTRGGELELCPSKSMPLMVVNVINGLFIFTLNKNEISICQVRWSSKVLFMSCYEMHQVGFANL